MKKTKKVTVTPIDLQTAILHGQAIDWLRKHMNKFFTPQPLTRQDAMTPMSVEIDPIGKRKVRRHVAVNPQMSRVISPFKKVITHMN